MRARYTILLRDLMLNPHAKEHLDKALSTYPLYKPAKSYDIIPTREELNAKILNHYKYREIGFETPGRFFDELEITMNEIMPRYNELFKTVEIMAELPSPFDNVDVTETFEQESSGSSTQTGRDESNGTSSQSSTSSDSSTTSGEHSQTDNNKRLTSDTPQSSISVGTKEIDYVSYASEAEWNEHTSESSDSSSISSESESSSEGETFSESSSESSSTSQGTVKHTFTKKGNQGVNTYAHDMNEFRTSIIDVVTQIINDGRINELFMLVY